MPEKLLSGSVSHAVKLLSKVYGDCGQEAVVSAETLREAAIDPGSYGAVLRSLVRCGILVPTGYAKSSEPSARGRVIRLYRFSVMAEKRLHTCAVEGYWYARSI